jgi:NTP pyrophosphatase (non-canonical NTP hydrolase)
MFGISDNFVNKCVEHFESDGQLDILQEECAELIKACSKVKRGKDNSLENLKEELAHVAISSAVVANILGITQEDIQKEVDKKADKYKFY